jgi:predicted RNase H-like HicB family nuclease
LGAKHPICYISPMKREEAISTLHAQYVCTFRPEGGSTYTVRCAAFPELITNGRTLEEARHNAREALELCLEVYQDEAKPVLPRAHRIKSPVSGVSGAISKLRLGTLKPSVTQRERREHEQVQAHRGKQATEDHDRHRSLDLAPRVAHADRQRQDTETGHD